MKTVFKKMKKYLLILVLFLGLAAQSFSQFHLQGDAAAIGQDTFQLTYNSEWSSGSILHKSQHDLNNSFQIDGKIFFGSDENGADGIVFVMQEKCSPINQAGGGMGYENMPGNSIGVEFDTFENGNLGDLSSDHIALHRNGNINHNLIDNLQGPVPMHAGKPDVEDGIWYDFEIEYLVGSSTLNVFFDGSLRLSHNIDLADSIFKGKSNVYWGFYSATGGEFAPNSVVVKKPLVNFQSDSICGGKTSLELPPLQPTNIALGRTTNSSSSEFGSPGPPDSDLAFDADLGTRWSSQFSDPQWISIDFGQQISFDSITLHWEAAFGYEYKVQTSNDNQNWTDIFHEVAGNGGIDRINVAASNIQYLRMYGIQRGTPYGYSLWEFQVFGTSKYSWEPKNQSIDISIHLNPFFAPDTSTTYTLSYIDACVGPVEMNYTIIIDDFEANAIVNPDSGLAPLEVNFSNLSRGWSAGDFIFWDFGNGQTTNQNDPSFSFLDTGNYNVKMIIFNSDSTCTDTTFLKIFVYEEEEVIEEEETEDVKEMEFIIPNIFTPNNDGFNDIFKITPTNAIDFEVVIYNRWGQMVFSWNSPSGYWDGKNQLGFEVPDGTYFYSVSYKNTLRGFTNFNGSISLIR